MIEVLILLGGIITGIMFHRIYSILSAQKVKKRRIEATNVVFKEVLRKIESRNSTFKSRFLHTTYISTNIESMGEIDLIYLMDKPDIAILKDNEVKHTSEHIDLTLKTSIINAINYYHATEVNDVVNFFGLILSRKDFETNFKMKFEDFNKLFNIGDDVKAIEPTEKPEPLSLDVDDILDKINKNGLSSLTYAEKKYLNDISNRED